MGEIRTRNKKRIREAIESLFYGDGAVEVEFEGEAAPFTSKIIKVEHGDTALKSGKRETLILGGFSPEKGDALIQSARPMEVRFALGEVKYHFTSHFVAKSLESPYFGYIITYPEELMNPERRTDSRYEIGSEESPPFVNARFTLRESRGPHRKYDLKVYDISKNGVGIVVWREQYDLLDKMSLGKKLEEMSLFGTWTEAKVSGLVKHTSMINEGKYRGHYRMGIKLDESLEPLVS